MGSNLMNSNKYYQIDYDVPKSRRGVYNKLRDKLRRISIMRTWSVYLVRLEYRDRIAAILEDFNKDPDEEPVRWNALKFDDSESEKLDEWVKEEFQKSLKRVKDNLQQKLGEAEMDDNLHLKDKALVQRDDLSAASKKVKEARRLATVFGVTDFMEAGFAALENLVDARRLKITDELKKAKAEAEAKDAKPKKKSPAGAAA